MTESRTIVVTIIGTGVALGLLVIGVVMNQTSGLNLRIDDLRDDLTAQSEDLRRDLTNLSEDLRRDLTAQADDLRRDLTAQTDDPRRDLTAQIDGLKSDMLDMRTRLRSVEISFGKVDQRLLTLERMILPRPDPVE